jgi:hypothetical protein
MSSEGGGKKFDWMAVGITALVLINLFIIILVLRERGPASPAGPVQPPGQQGPPGAGQAFGPGGPGAGGQPGFGPGGPSPGGPQGPGRTVQMNSPGEFIDALLATVPGGQVKLTAEQKKKILALLNDLPEGGEIEARFAEIEALLDEGQKNEIRTHRQILQQKAMEGIEPGGSPATASSVEAEALAYLQKRAGNAKAPSVKVSPPSPGAPPDPSRLQLGLIEIPVVVLHLKEGGDLELTPEQAAGVLAAYNAIRSAVSKGSNFAKEMRSILTEEQVEQLKQALQASSPRPDPEGLSKLKKALAS